MAPDVHWVRRELDAPYALGGGDIAAFREQGFARLNGVLSPEILARYEPEISRLARELARDKRPLAERETYGQAFLQVTNLWRRSELVRELVFSERLARLAANLLETPAVRLYHDQALYKEPGGGLTPAHADQFYWPFASDRIVTAWIPLQAVTADMGPLGFYAGSHRCDFGRDLGISDESEQRIRDHLDTLDYPFVLEPFALGDISFHLGWTFHRAPANRSAAPRSVMTIIYMDADMRLAQPANTYQQLDAKTWCPDVDVGGQAASPLNPVLYAGDNRA
ncbi:MAG TPA: phytanoyl-CoA dioxygenase family protein [Caulobacteraceae bacterium]|jgi:ectoine hydroxylase-related dioxygenase (phytanoyl-CoA dioxygenase family)|nr:phytanoyl-CoA dioxygenase family protein [Caulobacteraceae bacterium]